MERCPSCDQPISDSLRVRPQVNIRVTPNKLVPQDGSADTTDFKKTEYNGLTQVEIYRKYHHEASESNWKKVQVLEGLLDPMVDSKNWVGNPDKFLRELPPTVVFPVEGGIIAVTLIDDNCMETLWYVKWSSEIDEYAGGDVVIRRKDSIAYSDAARSLNYRNCVWMSLDPDGRHSPSETGLRPFQNIGFDVYETF